MSTTIANGCAIHLLRRVPVPARGDLAGGALVPPLRTVLPRRRRTPRRTRHRRRPRHHLPVGATLHAATHRRRQAVPSQLSGTAGSSTRPTSRSPVSGATCTEPSTSTARSSTCTSRNDATSPPPGTSSTSALAAHGRPVEVTTDLAAPLLRVIDELIPEAVHDTEQYSTDVIVTPVFGRRGVRGRVGLSGFG